MSRDLVDLADGCRMARLVKSGQKLAFHYEASFAREGLDATLMRHWPEAIDQHAARCLAVIRTDARKT